MKKNVFAVLLVILLLALGGWAQAKPATAKAAGVSRVSRAQTPALLASTGKYEIGRYLNIQSASAPDYSPLSDEVIFLSNVTGVNQVWETAPGRAPQQITFYEDRVQRVHWSPRGDVILFSKDQGGDERGQLYLMTPDGETVVPLTSNPKVIHQFGDFSRDGKMICYSSNERSERFFDVYVMDLATRTPRRLLEADTANLSARSFSPDGKSVLVARENSNSDNDLFLVDVAGGKPVHLTPHQGEAEYRSMEWVPDGSGFYLASNQDRDKSNLAFYDRRSKSLKFVEDVPYEIDELKIDRGGTKLFYSYSEDGISAPRVRDLKTGQVQKVPSMPKGVVGGAAFSGDGSKVAFSFNGAARNSDIYVWDLKTNKVAQVTHSSRAGIPAASFVEPELIKYKSFDGTMVPAFFYLPKGAKKDARLPVIVHVHGGPEGQERPGFNPVYQYFVNRGYAILAPNIRGSSGFGKKYIHMDDYKKRPDAIKDVAMSVEFLKASGYIDPKKIVVMGGSYGGFMTLAQTTMNPDLWAAAVDIVGIANWSTFFKHTGAWRRSHRASEYGDPDRDPEFMASISPITYVDNIKAPLFVIAGANDPRVPKEEADQMVEKVRAKGVPVEYIAFPDEGHGMAKRANRIRGYSAIADFLDKYVMGKSQ